MKIGIIGAMESEVTDLVSVIHHDRVEGIARMTFHEGVLAGVPVVVVQCGVGKVSAAVCAQILCDRFHVTHLINTGVAGALDDRLSVGDVVVSTDAIHHDMDVTNLGYEPGQVPGYPTVFRASVEMRHRFRKVFATEAADITVLEGRVASGERFVSSVEDRAQVHERFGALCSEMEGAAIAQTAWLNNVPFLILRAMSDKADGSGTDDYTAFETMAASRMAKLLIAALPTLGD